MTALNKTRDTVQYSNSTLPSLYPYPVKSNTTIYQGSLVCLESGYAIPATVATSLICVGRAEETVVNPTGGTLIVRIRQGCFRWGNSSSGDLITFANVGATCYMVDDQTVALTGAPSGTPPVATRSVAGTIALVDTDGVWVVTRF